MGTYLVVVRGFVNNYKYVDYTFSLTISSCASVVITPSDKADVLYLIVPSGTPITVTMTAFTSTRLASQCGALTYDLQLKSSTPVAAISTVLPNPPYTYTAG